MGRGGGVRLEGGPGGAAAEGAGGGDASDAAFSGQAAPEEGAEKPLEAPTPRWLSHGPRTGSDPFPAGDSQEPTPGAESHPMDSPAPSEGAGMFGRSEPTPRASLAPSEGAEPRPGSAQSAPAYDELAAIGLFKRNLRLDTFRVSQMPEDAPAAAPSEAEGKASRAAALKTQIRKRWAGAMDAIMKMPDSLKSRRPSRHDGLAKALRATVERGRLARKSFALDRTSNWDQQRMAVSETQGEELSAALSARPAPSDLSAAGALLNTPEAGPRARPRVKVPAKEADGGGQTLVMPDAAPGKRKSEVWVRDSRKSVANFAVKVEGTGTDSVLFPMRGSGPASGPARAATPEERKRDEDLMKLPIAAMRRFKWLRDLAQEAGARPEEGTVRVLPPIGCEEGVDNPHLWWPGRGMADGEDRHNWALVQVCYGSGTGRGLPVDMEGLEHALVRGRALRAFRDGLRDTYPNYQKVMDVLIDVGEEGYLPNWMDEEGATAAHYAAYESRDVRAAKTALVMLASHGWGLDVRHAKTGLTPAEIADEYGSRQVARWLRKGEWVAEAEALRRQREAEAQQKQREAKEGREGG
eukprot:TRINITY_DN27618_c0_g1_i2.p1 TRINITY_DN27618_c0_g1~~TRINITY_DN27618_c0_g1_i2.p1  ORF type:complete len:589 (+),score=133.84 TRINITY_DN27618_c0_g1_i2:26-1768(+)